MIIMLLNTLISKFCEKKHKGLCLSIKLNRFQSNIVKINRFEEKILPLGRSKSRNPAPIITCFLFERVL